MRKANISISLANHWDFLAGNRNGFEELLVKNVLVTCDMWRGTFGLDPFDERVSGIRTSTVSPTVVLPLSRRSDQARVFCFTPTTPSISSESAIYFLGTS